MLFMSAYMLFINTLKDIMDIIQLPTTTVAILAIDAAMLLCPGKMLLSLS